MKHLLPEDGLLFVEPDEVIAVPREVATCPGCEGKLLARVEKYSPYDGAILRVDVRCPSHSYSTCIPADFAGKPVGDNHPSIVGQERAEVWVLNHVRCACYAPSN